MSAQHRLDCPSTSAAASSLPSTVPGAAAAANTHLPCRHRRRRPPHGQRGMFCESQDDARNGHLVGLCFAKKSACNTSCVASARPPRELSFCTPFLSFWASLVIEQLNLIMRSLSPFHLHVLCLLRTSIFECVHFANLCVSRFGLIPHSPFEYRGCRERTRNYRGVAMVL
jgi:hypothetical protein